MMLPWRALLLALACTLLVPGTATATDPQPAEQPPIKRLDGQRYQIGSIVVDKARRQFTVPGVVAKYERPEDALEFVAGTKGGHKLYETLLELDANAFEFNLACILIGLEAHASQQPSYHFDPRKVLGDPVAIFVSWGQGGAEVRRTPSQLLRVGADGPVSDDWVYTGSTFTPDGQYLAQLDGVLVGFVHDPASIIQHRTGLGLGAYGAVRFRPSAVPPPGTAIDLTVERLESRK